MLVFGSLTTLTPALALAVLIGMTAVIYSGGAGNIIQMTPPDHLRGRVAGTQSTMYNAGVQLGILVLGTLGSLVGISVAIRGAGGLVLLTALAMFLLAPVRNAGRRGS